MQTRRQNLQLLGAGTAAALLPWPALAQSDRPLVIADPAGDRGLLAPFTHHRNGFAYVYTSYLFDALASQDRDGTIIPALAESWELAQDGLSCDITLRGDAKWHDGQPVTVEDVLFTFAYHSEKAYNFVSLKAIAKAEATGGNSLRLTLTQPDASLITGTFVTMPILPKHIYQAQDTPGHFTDAAAAIGSGPYMLQSYDKAQGRYLLRANPDYYGGTPRFDRLAIVKMGPDAALRGVTSGEVDIIAKLPFPKIKPAREAGLTVLTDPGKHPIRLVFNHKALFAGVSLRHGLAHAVDRQALVDVAYRGIGAVVAETGYFQKGSVWRAEQDDPDYAFDPTRAAELLTAGGWTRGDDGRWMAGDAPLSLRLIAEKNMKGLGTALAEQLEGFGIGIELRLLERAAIVEQAKKKDYDLALFTASSMGDPTGAARRVFGKVWRGDGYSPSAEMKAAMQAQAAALTVEDRMGHLHRFQALYAAELPSYMLVDPVWVTVHSDRLTPAYLPDGIALGVPLALHKSMLLQ